MHIFVQLNWISFPLDKYLLNYWGLLGDFPERAKRVLGQGMLSKCYLVVSLSSMNRDLGSEGVEWED